MKRQQGVALITVLLVVAVVTVVCAGLIARQHLAIRSSANLLNARQAWHYALGGERLAEAVLARDVRQGDPRAPVDHLGEPWAQPISSFALEEGGELRVRIEDPSGRLNLNGLVRQRQVNQPALERFRRLLLRLKIEEPYAERLVDWLDAGEEPSGGEGAEDNQYLLLQPAYRAANRALADVSELRLLLGMQEQEFLRLQPYISALPADTGLNVNTASPMVLSTLADGLTPEMAMQLVAARGRQGYRSVEEFLAQPTLAGLGIAAPGLAVGSHYFQVICEVSLDQRRQVLVSTLQRDDEGKLRVLGRDLGQSGLPPAVATEEKE